MLFAGLVVHQHALLHGFGGQSAIDVLFSALGLRQLRGDFKRVVGAAAVAAGVAGDEFERVVVGSDFKRAEAALFVFQSPPQERRDLLFGQRFKHVDTATREQRGDDFEGRILGRRADQPDGAALHVGQKRILLRLVEAVNLVDEENGARMHLRGLGGRGHDLLDLLDAAHDGGELDEAGLGGFGNDLGQRGFAHARADPRRSWSRRSSRLDLHAQRLAGADQVLLAAQFLKRARAHALGQRRGARACPWGPSGSPSKRLIAALHEGPDAAVLTAALARRFVEQHAGGDGGVQAFHGPGQGIVRRRRPCAASSAGTPLPSLPMIKRDGRGQIDQVGGLGSMNGRGPDFDSRLAQVREALRQRLRLARQPEDAAGRGAHRLGIPRAHGSGQGDTPSAPKASAERRMVPRLPGS